MARSVYVPCDSSWVFYLYPNRLGEDSNTFGEMEEDWDDFIENLQYIFQNKFKSLSKCDRWIQHEGHIILENTHADIGISDFCGCVSVWCISHDGENLSENWCVEIKKSVSKMLLKMFPNEMMVSLGRCSNGEQIFAPVNNPSGCITSKEGKLW